MTRWRSTRSALLVPVTVIGTLVVGACSSDGPVARSADSSTDASAGTATDVERWRVEVVDTVEHDRSAFTQGFLFDDDGRLWEGTGLVGQSALRELDPDTGAVRSSTDLPATVFGEGLALGPDGLVQLTWQQRTAYRWTTSAEPLGTFTYDGEGWGLTFDGEHFIQSDGSAMLTWRDPSTFATVRTVEVTLEGEPLDQLNELEWVDGAILANIWHSDDIVRIDPTTGTVSAVIDASSLWVSGERGTEMTLNGIAHRPGDPSTRLWLTGKQWPQIHIVDVVEAAEE